MHPSRVLLVDDDPHIRAIYGGRLRADGFDVALAADGRQALIAALDRPALVLLDLRMPEMSGAEVLDRLKSDVCTADVPVVMLSNDCDPDTMAACARSGAAAWWRKCSLTPVEVSQRVRELLSEPALAAITTRWDSQS